MLDIVFPSLKNLEVIFSISLGNGIWYYILPECDENLGFSQIKILSTSITTGPYCSSELMQRCISLFPNLTLFQHVIKDGDKFHGCKHRYQNRNLVETQMSADYAETLINPGHLDHDLRKIIKMGPMSKECSLF